MWNPVKYFIHYVNFLFSLELPEDSKLQLSEATVIVCPASLVHQWHKEIEKRVNKMNLNVCLYHGANREKRVKRY